MSFIDQQVGRLLAAGTRLVAGASARWVNCEPSARQRIYYANHSSHLDILLLWASLPGEVRRLTRPAAARDYWDTTPARRYLALRVFNAILIDRPQHGAGPRAALQSIEDTVAALGSTHSLIIFPEGTRGEGYAMAPFRGGIYHLAKRLPGVELVPVFLENLNRILPKGELVPVPLLSSISFGPPLVLAPDEKKADFLARAQQAVRELQEI
jgi:1-acyl-sn-glycerol-3-phosphate acyltransferase